MESGFRIEKYYSNLEDIWDSFIDVSLNGTIFHKRKFINYHGPEKFTDHSLLFYEGRELKAVFPAAEVLSGDKRVLKSHPGTSYGGVVLKDRVSLRLCMGLFAGLNAYGIDNGFGSVEFRLCERIFLERPLDQVDFALLHNGYEREAEELSTCYYLPPYSNADGKALYRKFDDGHKNKIRQNINGSLRYGLTTGFLNLDDTDDFYTMLEKNLEKYGVRPVHSLEELKWLFANFPEEIRLFGAKHGEKVVCAFLIMKVNARSWHIFYSALDYECQHMRPLNLCLTDLIGVLADQGYEWLNFGISTEKGGKHINYGLFRFKESFGGFGALRTYWKKDLEKKES